MKVRELSVYDDPFEGKEVVCVPNLPTPFTETVSSVYKTTSSAIDSTMKLVETVEDKVAIGKAHTSSALEVLQNDPGSLPRAGVITVAGLGGIVAGYRRGFFRRGVYSGLAMVVAASVCYPNQAVDIANTGYIRARDEALKQWNNLRGTQTEREEKAVTGEKKPVPVDMGQSKPEDKDMYTTRS